MAPEIIPSLRAALAGVFLLILTCAAQAAEPAWKVGMATAKITPDKPVFMSGYASRDHPSEGVVADLYVKALALTDETGARSVLVTSDLIGFRADVAKPICERITAETGLERSRILLNSSHTHTGPSTSAKSVTSEKMSQADADRVFEYTQWFSDRVVEVVVKALAAEPRPAELSCGVGVAPFVMNRREVTDTGVILGTNPRGPADRSVPVLKIASPGGEKLLAVVFQAAAHNTTLGGNFYEICGDYAGFSQEYVEDKNPGVQAMFMLGCAGDANPYPRGTLEMARVHGAALGAEVCRVLDEAKLVPVRGPLRTEFTQVELPLEPILGKEEIREFGMKSGGWRSYVASKMLELHEKGEPAPAHYTAPMALWQFGDDLTLVGLSGEVVVDYVFMVEKALGRQNRLWISAYCNDVFGYLPSARVLREGGYETRGIYTGVGLFSPEAQDVVVEAVRGMAKAAGREGAE